MGRNSELDDNVSFTEASTSSSEGTQLICQSSIDVLMIESSSSNSFETKKQPEISIKSFGGPSSDTSQLSEQLCPQKNSEQGPNLCVFDLNEDLEMNDEQVSAEPITVVAKIGVPNALAFALPRFDGETSWRSAPTSAFRPALPSKNPRDFDLNIAASEMEHSDPEQSGRFSLNLDESRGFDLNDKLLIDQRNLQGVRPVYWVDLGSMPAHTHVQGQPFMVTAPRTHVPMALGPRSYIGPANGLYYSQSFLPSPGFQYGLGGAHMSQITGPMIAAGYTGGLSHPQAAAGQGGSLLSGEVSGNGSRAAVFPGLACKRREPEGGWDCFPVSRRRAGAWM